MDARLHAAALLAAVLTVLPAPAGAQSRAGAQAARRARAVAASPQGAPFRSAGQEYRLVLDLRAVRAGGGAVPETAGLAPVDVIDRAGPYLVVSTRDAGARQARPVAVNVLTGQLGVVTGIVTARVGSAAEAVASSRAAGVALELFNASTGWAFFRVPDGADPLAAAAALAARGGVPSPEVEVKEAWDQPE